LPKQETVCCEVAPHGADDGKLKPVALLALRKRKFYLSKVLASAGDFITAVNSSFSFSFV